MLRILKIISTFIIALLLAAGICEAVDPCIKDDLVSGVCKVNDGIKDDTKENVRWANDLRNSSTEMVWQNLKEKFKEQEQLEMQTGFELSGDEQLPRQFAGLYIFVSTSMPKPLLSDYLAEAVRYGGVLVLKGLPNGSFRELTKLITELTSKDEYLANSASFQIDDEAFEKFTITSVPTMVIAKEEEYHPNQSSMPIYDKISGNVGIRFALEKFAQV